MLIVSAIITLFVFFALRVFDEPLRNSVTPGGIVSFEFAKDIDTAKEMINSWDVNAKVNAALSLGIDYLFLVAYSLFLSISIFLVAKKFDTKYTLLWKIGSVMSILVLVTGLCDAIENYALIKLLLGSENTIFPKVAYYFASIKFLLVGVGLLYILIGLILKPILKAK